MRHHYKSFSFPTFPQISFQQTFNSEKNTSSTHLLKEDIHFNFKRKDNMIFSTEFYDKEPTHYSATEYKGLPIDAASVPHFSRSRSFSLIHNLYSK